MRKINPNDPVILKEMARAASWDKDYSLSFKLYEEGFSKEGRLVRQTDRIEKLLQAIDYKNRNIYKPNIDPYWVQLKTLLDDPTLIEFVEKIDRWYFKEKPAS